MLSNSACTQFSQCSQLQKLVVVIVQHELLMRKSLQACMQRGARHYVLFALLRRLQVDEHC